MYLCFAYATTISTDMNMDSFIYIFKQSIVF